MLEVSLGRLGREGAVRVEASVPADHEMWDATGIGWEGPVDVRLTVSFAGTGEVVVRGHVGGTLAQECRRCLRPVAGRFDEDVTMVFAASDEVEDEEVGEAHVYDPTHGTLDLEDAVREEVVLAVKPYVVCDPTCKGLCPKCGTDLNEGTCDCSENEPDPRWEALRALKDR